MYFDRSVIVMDYELFEMPRAIGTVREWSVVNSRKSDSFAAGAVVPCFVAPCNRSYCDIYHGGNLRYIFTLYNGKPRLAKYVGAPQTSPDLDSYKVNHGDHLTFCFIKNSEALRVRTHLTTYSEDLGPPATFHCNPTGNCSFDMSPTEVSEDDATVPNPVCYSPYKNAPQPTLKDMFPCEPLAVDIVRSLIKVIAGVPLKPAEKVNGGTGGALGEPVSYKDITFFNEKFARFLSSRIISRVKAARFYFELARVFFDEGNYFGPAGSKHIIIVYDFREECAIFYVNAKTAMVACYAEAQPEEALTPYERACLRDFRSATSPERVLPPEIIMRGRRAARRAAGREKRAAAAATGV